MKKLLILSLVLGIASLATAGLSIGGYDGSELKESDTIVLTIVGDGDTPALDPTWLVVVSGPGSVDPAQANLYMDAVPGVIDLGPILGQQTIMFNTVIPTNPPPALDGLVGDIVFHCDGPGDVLIQLVNGSNMLPYDEILIKQVPEPATMGLLALGGLFLRRRK